jgi:hypothetical protein
MWQAELDRLAAEKAAVEAQAAADLAAAAEAAELAACEAFGAAWKKAPANQRGRLTLKVRVTRSAALFSRDVANALRHPAKQRGEMATPCCL